MTNESEAMKGEEAAVVTKNGRLHRSVADDASPFITPSELARRWQCSRSSVDRIARRAGLHRLLLGEGKNGLVRYLKKEVMVLENKSIL